MFKKLAIKGLTQIGTLSLLLAASSCQNENSDSKVKGVAVAKSELWQQNVIDVCWESDADNITDFKEEVRNHIVSNFNKTALKLRGWTSCSEYDETGEKADIRIFTFDNPEFPQGFRLSRLKAITKNFGHPRVRALGRPVKGISAGLILTYQFKKVFPGLVKQQENLSEQGKSNLKLSIALHEMGHAIGLRHEDAHPERTCDDFAESISSARAVGRYNAQSIMSRCFYRNFDYENGKLSFNKGDVETINSLYSNL